MDASCVQRPCAPATCAVEITSVENTDIAATRKAKMVRGLHFFTKKFDAGESDCVVGYSSGYLAGLPKVNPMPVVTTTLFFVLPGTGWLTYWSRKFALAVIQLLSLVAIPAVKFMR